MKRFISILLTTCLLLLCMPGLAEEAQVFDAGAYTFELSYPVQSLEATDAYAKDAVQTAARAGITLTPFFGYAAFLSENMTVSGFTCQYPQNVVNELFLTADEATYVYTNLYRLLVIMYGEDAVEDFLVATSDSTTQDGAPLTMGVNTEMGVAVYASYQDGKSFLLTCSVEDTEKIAYASIVAGRLAETAKLNKQQTAANQKVVVVTGESAKVRTEPSLGGGLITTVYQGDRFEYQGESGDFYAISINGRTGYIHKGVTAVQ